MLYNDENVKKLEAMLAGNEKLDIDHKDGIILSAIAYVDDYVRKEGDFSKGNYFRVLYASGASAAALG